MTALTIGQTHISTHHGLYCLNDLHKASGNHAKHQPALFLRLDQTQALIAEIQSTDSQTATKSINGGNNRGTYACRELVIAYAAWISPSFHLKVIRTFLNTVNSKHPDYETLVSAIDLLRIQDSIEYTAKYLPHTPNPIDKIKKHVCHSYGIRRIEELSSYLVEGVLDFLTDLRRSILSNLSDMKELERRFVQQTLVIQ